MPVAGLGGISAGALMAIVIPHVFGGPDAAQHQARVAFRLNGSTQPLTGLRPRPPAHLPSNDAARPGSPAVRSTVRTHTTVLTASTTTPKATHTASRARPVTHHPILRQRSPGPLATAATGHPTPTATTRPQHRDQPAPPALASERYVNPLAHASVTSERIDQGVDYSGSGTLGAIGPGTITYLGTSGTGWPGAFIEFRLTGGPDGGRYVYYAESVVPSPGLHVGQTLSTGQTVATITGGIEIGWGAGIGTETYAAANGQWSHANDSGNVATPAGRSFSALIASLGGPAGIVEG